MLGAALWSASFNDGVDDESEEEEERVGGDG